jgi:cellulose synthase/poly-beta-1,6-N-acetylglucosamine synthase-like glycosyltransferase
MMSEIFDSLVFLFSQSELSFLLMFWIVIVFEIPRYTLLFLTAIATSVRAPRPVDGPPITGRVGMIIAGHNVGDSVENFILCLHEQSRPPDEIIVVSDGSTDRMTARLNDLMRRGLIQQAHSTDMRAGKAAATNLAARNATGDILINADPDGTFDRDAIKAILEPFTDPQVGAVCGNLMVRYQTRTLITAFQAIEYLITISLGKRAALLTDQVVCVSGAFGAFRRDVLEQMGWLDIGGGEDLDLTIRIRKAGWKVSFAADAIAYTQAPWKLRGFIRQRLRWERDAIRLRYRKHREQLTPFSHRFHFREFVHQVEFLFFNILATAALPVYVVWLILTYGDLAPLILLAAQFGLIVLDYFVFTLAAIATPKARSLELVPYVFGYSFFSSFVMRAIRSVAYVQEWVFDASSKDDYIPRKVNLMRRW